MNCPFCLKEIDTTYDDVPHTPYGISNCDFHDDISVMLYSYFVWYGMSDKKEANSKIKNVKFISPSNKLKICDSADKQVDDAKNDESKEYNIKIKNLENDLKDI